MKCGNCGSEWNVDASKSSSFTVCPVCQEKLTNEKKSGWQFFDNTEELLAFIAAEYGNDALFQRKHFSDHSSPTLTEGQKNLIKYAYQSGAVKILEDNMTSDQARQETAVKQAVGKIVDKHHTAEEVAKRVVWELTNALGWGMAKPQGSTAQKPPDSTPTKTTTTATTPASTSDSETDKLMTRAWLFAEDGDWDDATTYFNRVLDTEPTYAMAYLGLLCVDLRVSKEKNLEKIKSPANITNHKHYKRAAADPAVKSRLDGYLQTIKDRIAAEQKVAAAKAEKERIAAEEAARRKQVQDAYDSASKIMDKAESPADYDKAIAALGNIDTAYQDISSQIKAKIAEGEKKKAAIITNFKKKYRVLWERLSDEGKAEAGERRKVAQAQLDEENEKAKAAHEAEYQRSVNEYQLNHEKWQATVANIKAEQEAKLSSWQAEVNRIKAENDALHGRWQEEVAAAQTQSEAWKSQGLCPHCGIGKIGFFGSCKECKRKGDEAITVPLPPGYIDYPPEPALPYNTPPEPMKPQKKAFTPRQLKAETTLPADVTATIKGEHVYVKMAGIDWLVLAMEEEKALLISEKVLEERPYHKDGGEITWEKCSLRKYLNDDFYNRLGAAKGAVAETKNSNPNNPWYETKGGSSTTDKVFLLSLDEVVRYFGDSGDLKNKRRKDGDGKLVSDGWYVQDKFNSARIAKDKKGAACWWWLRSPGSSSYGAARVSLGGSVGVDGDVVSADYGVRPALWLNL